MNLMAALVVFSRMEAFELDSMSDLVSTFSTMKKPSRLSCSFCSMEMVSGPTPKGRNACLVYMVSSSEFR
jgi:hypothetical protein